MVGGVSAAQGKVHPNFVTRRRAFREHKFEIRLKIGHCQLVRRLRELIPESGAAGIALRRTVRTLQPASPEFHHSACFLPDPRLIVSL